MIVNSLSPDDYKTLSEFIERQNHYIQKNDFKEVRSTDMAFHQYLITKSNHPHLMRNWKEIVAQVAAVLYLRAEGHNNYDEYLAIHDHKQILDAYIARDLEWIKAENRRINKRVETECVLALEKLQAR